RWSSRSRRARRSAGSAIRAGTASISASTGSAPRRPRPTWSSALASPPRRSCRRSARLSKPKEISKMATRVAINGFGRIGRLVARALLERKDSGLELVSVNDLADAESNALLFKRDSVHGPYPGEVRADGNDLVVDGRRI